jgi:hypothetical protein
LCPCPEAALLALNLCCGGSLCKPILLPKVIYELKLN